MASDAASTIDAAHPRTVRVDWAGWINVVVAAIIMLATLPGRTQGLGLITEPMLRDLQLDRITYANINLWATLLGAAICLPIGRVFDRAGLRATTVLLTLLLGAVVWSMSRVEGGAMTLFVLVLATRTLGQSALSVASITAVGKSFDRRVGVAMGVYSVLLSVFFAVAFTLVGSTVRTGGWRLAWAQVAYALVLLAAPAVLLLRERAAPGGQISYFNIRQQAAQDVEIRDLTPSGMTLGAALRSPAFWVFGIGTSLFGLVSSGLGLFNEAVLAERGFDQQTFVAFLAGTAIVALGGQLLCGWLTLHWPMPRLLSVAMAIYAAALIALTMLATAAQLWIVAALIGLSGGMITVMFFAVWGQAFGTAHLGRIQGAAQTLTVLASAIGPLIFAHCATLTGSYRPALWVLAPCVLLTALAALRTPMPQRHNAPTANPASGHISH
jgi:MFS family permease